MKSLFRILAVTIALLLFAAALMFYWGGQQMEFKAETLIRNTDINTVMVALGEPETWYDGVVEVQTTEQTNSDIGAAADITILEDGTRSTLNGAVLSQSDSSLTVRTWNEQDFDVFSIWQLEQAGKDVRVRQLMLATHKGFFRFEALLNKQKEQTSINQQLEQLKNFVETEQLVLPKERGQQASANDSEATEPTTETNNR
ncbi:MAG: hypothetical protein P8J33_12110 [Pirellulaceae bacterium]|nr:hypothetical protein [Pirellulaceae bacterium]